MLGWAVFSPNNIKLGPLCEASPKYNLKIIHIIWKLREKVSHNRFFKKKREEKERKEKGRV